MNLFIETYIKLVKMNKYVYGVVKYLLVIYGGCWLVMEDVQAKSKLGTYKSK